MDKVDDGVDDDGDDPAGEDPMAVPEVGVVASCGVAT